MISKRLARLFKKHFAILDPDDAVSRIAGYAATPGLPEEAGAVLAHFPEFLTSLDTGYTEYDDRLKIAVRNLDISSEELNLTNQTLERLNISINAMLESLGQALLFFNADGVCSPVFSKACLELLECNPSGRHITEVLRLGEKASADFSPLIGLMFDIDATALSFDDLIALAPRYYEHSQGLTVELSYKPMHAQAGGLIGVLLVATDITQERQAQERLKEKETQVLRTLRIAGNRSSFVHALRSLQAVFQTLGEAHALGDIRRDLHTVKGMANVFYLHDLAKTIHEMEDRLRALPPDDWRGGFARICDDYRTRLELAVEYARWLGREIWGMEFESGDDIISVPTGDLMRFGRDLRALMESGAASPDEVERAFFERVASQSVMDMLGFFETQLLYFSETADKRVRILHDAGDEVRVFPDFYRRLFDSLIHVARNVVDHAIDGPELRLALGKPPELQLRIRTVYADDARTKFRLVISDDGRGIRPDVLSRVFDEGFSTRQTADMHSGRGVGMNVVKRETEKLGGQVRIDSEEGTGTTLTFTLPVLWRSPGG